MSTDTTTKPKTPKNAETPTTHGIPTPGTAAAASLYQQLRAHLAVLKLHDAAEALPGVLDAAAAEKLSMTAALERLLAIEVDATEARRLAGRLRFACLPTPATLEDFNYDAAAGRDGARARLALLAEPVGEERLQCRCDQGHDCDPGRVDDQTAS